MRVQLSEVGLLGLELTGEVSLDLHRDVHLVPDASNELSHAGLMLALKASLVYGHMASRRGQRGHPLVLLIGASDHVAECAGLHTAFIAAAHPSSGGERPNARSLGALRATGLGQSQAQSERRGMGADSVTWGG